MYCAYGMANSGTLHFSLISMSKKQKSVGHHRQEHQHQHPHMGTNTYIKYIKVRVICIPCTLGWHHTCYVVEDDPELLILLPLHPGHQVTGVDPTLYVPSPQGSSMQEQMSELPSLYTAEQYHMHRHVVSIFQFRDHTAVNAHVQAFLTALERVHFGVELGALGILCLLT